MNTVKQNVRINWDTYDSYIAWQEMLVKEIVEEVNSLNNKLKSLIMVQGIWYDDNAAAFVKWYRNNESLNRGYERVADFFKYFLSRNATLNCKELKTIETSSYANYPNIRRHANAASFYDAIGQKYKVTNSKSLFTASQEKVAKGVATTASKTKMRSEYVSLNAKFDQLEESAELYDKMDLKFWVGNAGFYIDGMSSCNGAHVNKSGRGLSLVTYTNNVVKAQLNDALKKSGLYTL